MLYFKGRSQIDKIFSQKDANNCIIIIYLNLTVFTKLNNKIT